MAKNCNEAGSPMPVPQTCGTTVVAHAWAATFLHRNRRNVARTWISFAPWHRTNCGTQWFEGGCEKP